MQFVRTNTQSTSIQGIPPPKAWIDEDYSPTHPRILFMLDLLTDQFYTCGMDNSFISDKSLRAAYADTSSNATIYGICRTSGRELPQSVIRQDYFKDKNKANRMRGETKVAVLEGDTNYPSRGPCCEIVK